MRDHTISRKLSALQALCESTPFEGEAEAARLAIKRLEAKHSPNPSINRAVLMGPWQRTAWLLLLSGMKWSERERDFLESMRCKRSAPSERQSSWLKDLKAKGGWRYE